MTEATATMTNDSMIEAMITRVAEIYGSIDDERLERAMFTKVIENYEQIIAKQNEIIAKQRRKIEQSDTIIELLKETGEYKSRLIMNLCAGTVSEEMRIEILMGEIANAATADARNMYIDPQAPRIFH